MFDSDQKSTGTGYTTTVALLIMAFIVCPAVLVASRPVGYVFLSLATACSALMRDLVLGQLEEILTTHHPFHRDSGLGDEMTKGRVFTIRILCAGLGASLLCAGDLSHYREFKLGMNLSVAAKQAGMKPSEARTVHQRPPVIQELEWLPRKSGELGSREREVAIWEVDKSG